MADRQAQRPALVATTAVALAVALCGDTAYAWGPIGLSGAIGDWQHMGGWKGWNQDVLTRSTDLGHVRIVVQPAFIAVTLAEAIARFEPAIPGLHGDPRAIWADWTTDLRAGRALASGHHMAEDAPEELAAELVRFLRM